ncbi:helix-turn-helix domain-containing protein, partial [Pseudomonas aeruginosa]
MNRNERIARAIQLSGKTKSEIAKLCDVAPSAVTQWINGDSKSLKAESAFALAKATGFRAEWITLGSGPERAIDVGPDHNQGELVGLVSAWDADTPLEDDEVELPYYSEVELAAGNGMTEVVEIADRKLRFSKDTLRSAGVEPECAAVA